MRRYLVQYTRDQPKPEDMTVRHVSDSDKMCHIHRPRTTVVQSCTTCRNLRPLVNSTRTRSDLHHKHSTLLLSWALLSLSTGPMLSWTVASWSSTLQPLLWWWWWWEIASSSLSRRVRRSLWYCLSHSDTHNNHRVHVRPRYSTRTQRIPR